MALPSHLKHGTLVQILNTENVAQRFPDLVGELATVDKVPVYPSTWFTVKISQQPTRTVKMQPTALKLVSNSPAVSPHEENAPVKNRYAIHYFTLTSEFSVSSLVFKEFFGFVQLFILHIFKKKPA